MRAARAPVTKSWAKSRAAIRISLAALAAAVSAAAGVYVLVYVGFERSGPDESAASVARTDPGALMYETDSEDWLTFDDPRPASQWLVERTIRFSENSDKVRVISLASLLTDAERTYHEKRRMIANRIAQIVDVSAEYGEPVLPEEVLADLIFKSEEPGKMWFGIIAQAYIELRRGGLPHEAAVLEVRREFGRPSASEGSEDPVFF